MIDNGMFGLYAILTDPVIGYEACARAVVNQGVRFMQLRMKNKPHKAVLDMAYRIREITKGTDTLFIMNDDVRVAIEVDADGVHLGQEDMSIVSAEILWGNEDKIFGLSTHNETQKKNAFHAMPDYIGVGPVFPTPTKEIPDKALGLEQMRSIIKDVLIPTVAIGGIDEDNLHDVLWHGAVNFAVVRAINQSSEPEIVISRLMKIWRMRYPDIGTIEHGNVNEDMV